MHALKRLIVAGLVVAPFGAVLAQSADVLPWHRQAGEALEASQAAEAARSAADEAKEAARDAKAAAAAVYAPAGEKADAAAPAANAAAPQPASEAASSLKTTALPASEESPAAAAAPQTDEKGKPLPTPAKKLFGAVVAPANLKARAIGSYAKGCLAGAKALPVDGPAWQAMRLSRNRNWAHPELVALIEKFATEVQKAGEWPGLLVGDLSQPRGGPMLTGHASHQIGLDADIWFTPMPDRRLSNKERELIEATSMLASDDISVNPKVWGDGQVKIVKRVAGYSNVERVLVHPAIKKALCEAAGTSADRAWLYKVRPYWGHYYHFHVRIGCPAGSTNCERQFPTKGEDGCGKELEDWFKLLKPPKAPPKPKPEVAKPATPPKPKPQITLADLPADCKVVLDDGQPKSATASTAAAEPAAKPAAKSAPADKSKKAAAAPAKPAASKVKSAAKK